MATATRTIDPRRRVQAWVLAVAGPALLVGVLLPTRGSGPLAAALMLLLAVTLVVVSIGGRVPAAAAAVLGVLLVGGFLVAWPGSGLGDRLWALVALAGFTVLALWSIRLVDRSVLARSATSPEPGGDGV